MRPGAFAPFIVGGRAEFWDSWGEVRHAEAGLRPHLGQDVFCDYGAPVLASEDGVVEFAVDSSGGRIARLHRGDGSYWYYAHLASFPKGVVSGGTVSVGDVIGYCGTSGNAAGSRPHVHFGWYLNGMAMNPMGSLISWLRTAEREATRSLRARRSPRARRAGGGPRPRRSNRSDRPDAAPEVCPRRPGPPVANVVDLLLFS